MRPTPDVGCPGRGGGGATTTGPDVTPPQLSAKTCGGGGGRWEGGGGGIGSSAGGGGCARPTTTTCIPQGGVCVWGAWGYRSMYAIIAISRLCREESLKGLKDQRHSTPPLQLSMGQKKLAPLAPRPLHRYLSKLRGGGGGGCGSPRFLRFLAGASNPTVATTIVVSTRCCFDISRRPPLLCRACLPRPTKTNMETRIGQYWRFGGTWIWAAPAALKPDTPLDFPSNPSPKKP